MLTLRAPFLAVVPVAILAIACGGATAPLVDLGADDAGSPGSKDGGPVPPDGGEDAGGSARCPENLAGAVGTSCAREGETCAGDCSDPCSWCTEIDCVHGTWTEVGVAPQPCAPDAAAPRRWPDARLSWQGPGGVTGYGPAIVIGGDGVARIWESTPGFDPAAIPSKPPTRTAQLAGAQVDDLFDRWSTTDTAVLPHGDVTADCDGVVEEIACTTCTPTTIGYHTAGQLAPEMAKVWSWFTTTFPGVTAADPSGYCKL